MSQRFNLSAEPRTVLGKKVKQLRRDGLLPATVYGHKVDTQPVAVALVEFASTYKQAGETGLIDLQISGESSARPVLIHDMLEDPVTAKILHIDFYQVNLKEKLIATVPLEFVGESEVVKNNEGILLELLQEIEVECLPTDIPSSVEVNVSTLTEVDQGITAGELSLPEGVELKTDSEEMVCKVDEAKMSEEEIEEESTEESVEEETTENPDESDRDSGNE
jgi:large subunit ribosomal protein L25